MTAGWILLWALAVIAFGIGVAKLDRWLIVAGLLTQAFVLWEATAP